MKTVWEIFTKYAFKNGYKKKVVGNYAYKKTNSVETKFIKLLSAKNGKILVYEDDVGRYYIN